jgi:hypothetical protein
VSIKNAQIAKWTIVLSDLNELICLAFFYAYDALKEEENTFLKNWLFLN